MSNLLDFLLGDATMSPESFKDPCTVCNPDKPKVEQSIKRVGTEAFRRDAFGQIVSRPVGGLVGATHGGAPGTAFVMQPVQLQLQDGSWVSAFRSVGRATTDGYSFFEDHRFDADCHGLSFTDGQYWINDPDVNHVLDGGGFTETTTPKPGDVGVIRDANGNVVHSVTVTEVDPWTGAVLEVSGLGGIEMHEHVDTPAGAWVMPPPLLQPTITYYTK